MKPEKIIVKPPRRLGRLDAPGSRPFKNKCKYTRKVKHKGSE